MEDVYIMNKATLKKWPKLKVKSSFSCFFLTKKFQVLRNNACWETTAANQKQVYVVSKKVESELDSCLSCEHTVKQVLVFYINPQKLYEWATYKSSSDGVVVLSSDVFTLLFNP